MTGLSNSERISMICSAVLIQSTRVTNEQIDGQTDRRNWRGIYRVQHSVARLKLLGLIYAAYRLTGETGDSDIAHFERNALYTY